MVIDHTDRKILGELQQNSDRPISEIAELVNLSTNACWRRIKILQDHGVIRKQVSLLDQEKLGRELTVFVQIRTSNHSESWFNKFASGVRRIEEVVEFHRTSGNFDYLLKVIVANMKDYDRVYRRIIKTADLHDVTSYFSMERLKETTEIPLN